jgi:putative membrane protein
MILASLFFAFLAAALHVYIFTMESITWTRPATWKRFGVGSQADAETTRPLAYNQGFYNLFLAAGAVGGVAKALLGDPAAGVPVLLFACGSMVAAGVVLVTHNRGFWRPALIQIAPPLVAILAQVLLG